jgi:hypothetical protein
MQGDVYGSKPGRLGIEAKDLSHDCWDYIFLKGEYNESIKVPKD